MATQNPIEYEGTYPLPEAQLDRFLIRMQVGYPSAEDEWDMLERRLERREDEAELRAVVDRGELIAMQRAIEDVHVSDGVGRYIVALVGATRESPSVQVGASPRGSLALMKLSRARRHSMGATSSCRTTSRPRRCRLSRTGSRSGLSCGFNGSSPRMSSENFSPRCRCRRPTRSGGEGHPSRGAMSNSATNASNRYSRYRPSGPAWMFLTASAAFVNAPVIGR